VFFNCKGREKKGKKKKIIVGDNPIVFSCHAPLQIKEKMMEHPRR
jgi:hypothetical protein